MGLFSRKKEEKKELGEASERLIMEQLQDDDELVLNFEKLDLLGANKFLAFFTGVVYALDGKYVKINETTYLFARQEEFKDGSLNDFLSELDED